MKKALKILVWLIILGGALFLAGRTGYRRYLEKKSLAVAKTAPTAGSESVRVVCRRVETRDVRQIASLTGTVHPMAEVRVMAKVSGRLEELRLEDGTPVDEGLAIPKKGVRLAVIDHEAFAAQVRQADAALAAAKAEQAKVETGARPQELEIAKANVRAAEAAVLAAKATVAQAEATLKNATSDVERIRNLYKDNVVAKQQLDNAEAAHSIAKERLTASQEQARSAAEALRAAREQLALTEQGARQEDRAAIAAKVQHAEATLQLARINFEESTLLAPIAGVVSRKNLDEGNMVSPGVAIVTLVQVDTVKVAVGANERDIALVAEGKTRVTVRADAYPDEPFAGTVYRVSPVADERTRTVEVEIRVPNPQGRLKPGMFARVELVLRERKGVPVIPENAVTWVEDEPFVTVVNDGKAHRRAVKLGLAEGPAVEVTEGLQAGALVVTRGQQGLKEGDRVVVEEEPPK